MRHPGTAASCRRLIHRIENACLVPTYLPADLAGGERLKTGDETAGGSADGLLLDRDQAEIMSAREHFERLIKKFPKSIYARRAERKIRECYIILAEHELYVGRFYYQKRKYRAAYARFRYVVETYPDLGQYHEALEYMAKCKEKIPEEDAEAGGSWWYKLLHPIY